MTDTTTLIQPWPYSAGSFMTPDVVWTCYLNEQRMRKLWEAELKNCVARIHNQRLEIKRLQMELQKGCLP